MSEASIYKYSDLNIENFIFKGPRKDESRYNVYVTYKNDLSDLPTKIYVQTPKMRLRSSLEDSFIDFVFPGNTPFSNFITEMDAKILHKIKEKKEEWFGTEKIIEDSFFDIGQCPSIKMDGEEKQHSRIKLRVPCDTVIYNSSKEEIDKNQIEKNAEMTSIIQLAGIWFTKSRWGITWKAIQLKTHAKKDVNVKYMFDDDYDHDEILDPPPGLG